ncbi:MAG: hypothetical protein CMF46_00540 [Legionellales bacterium]|nr:hypothetical protein [Legionellales bacterium]
MFIAQLLIFLWVSQSFAVSPVEIINEIDKKINLIVHENKQDDQLTLTQYLTSEMVGQIAVSDFIELVLGDAWHDVSEEKKSEFRNQFVNLVVDDYSSVMKAWADPSVSSEFKMFPIDDNQVVAKVYGKISVDGADDFLLVFDFVKKQDQWCFLDMSVAGVSFSKLYQEEFATTMSDRGIDGLISMLKKQN